MGYFNSYYKITYQKSYIYHESNVFINSHELKLFFQKADIAIFVIAISITVIRICILDLI